MGRKPVKPNAVPRLRLRTRGSRTYYYYDHGIGRDGKRREESLGTDYAKALIRWAELEGAVVPPPAALVMFRWVADQYLAKVAAFKAARTFSDNQREMESLLAFFDDPPAPLDAIAPEHVEQFKHWRTKDGAGFTRANREKALLSHIWNWARSQGYTKQPNPCAGIKGFREAGRHEYIEDAQYDVIWNNADACLRDAMDLAYLTGQRPADTLRLSEMDCRDGMLYISQDKTHAKLRIAITGELAALLDRIRSRKRAIKAKVFSTRLIVNEYGRSLGVNAMSRRWAKACKQAGVKGLHFRDLRAKAGTDKTESTGDIRQAQRQLGHSKLATTEIYIRNRRGDKVTPTK